MRVGRVGLAAEELHDSEHVVGQPDGEREGRAQARSRGADRAEEARIVGKIRNADGLTALPDPPRQSDPGREAHRARGGFEVRNLHRLRPPDGRTA